MSNATGAHDPSVAVRRRHLPFAESAKGRKLNYPFFSSATASVQAPIVWSMSARVCARLT